MKIFSVLAIAVLLIFWPIGEGLLTVQAAGFIEVSESPAAAPVSQPLVREGDFAVKLAQVLDLGTTDNEAEAESMLSTVGIAPENGWIADYPVTPDIIRELRQEVLRAADHGQLALGKDEALGALQTVADGFGLYVEINQPGGETQASQPPPGSTESYVNPTVVNNYYYHYGPPIVTYYPPPTDYFYLYVWVPFPFWWYGFYYPGFFILHDFDRVVVFHRDHPRLVTNHVFDHRKRRFYIIDRHGRRFVDRNSRSFNHAGNRFRRRGFESSAAGRGAESILKGSLEHRRGFREGVPRAGRHGGKFHARSSPGALRGGRSSSPGGFRSGFNVRESHGGRAAVREFRGRKFHGQRAPGRFRGGGLQGEYHRRRFAGGFRSRLNVGQSHGARSPGAVREFRGREFEGRRSPSRYQGGEFQGKYHKRQFQAGLSGGFQGRGGRR